MAKKNKKNRPPDFDPNQRKKERIEARRQAKAEALERQRKAQRRERIVRRIGYTLLLVLAFWFLFLRGGAPDAIAGHEIEHYSTTAGTGAEPDHVTTDVTYEMSPPVSGQHRQASAACGTHATPLEDELFVHTLEHGTVAVLYEPALPVEQVRQIEEIVGGFSSHTLAAPYIGEMETPIAVVAWGHTMRLDTVDRPAINEFIDVFRQGGDAPERLPCDNEAEEEFEPETTPAPGESPGASPAPAESPTPVEGETPASPEPGGDKKKRETPAP